MIYRQDGHYLRYEEIPVSSVVDRFTPQSRDVSRFVWKNEKKMYVFVTPHNHLACEILWLQEGEMLVEMDDSSFWAKKGDVIFFNPFDIHKIYIEITVPEVRYLVTVFDIDFLKIKGGNSFNELLSNLECGKVRAENLIHPGDPFHEEIVRSLEQVYVTYGQREKPQEFARLFAGLLNVISAFSDGGFFVVCNDENHSKQISFAQSVVLYIGNHYMESITLEMIAKELHYSKYHFCRNFKKVFGISFLSYLNNFRISIAAGLDIDKYSNIGEIAEAVGYPTYSVFATHFRNNMGISPSDYYKRSKNNLE